MRILPRLFQRSVAPVAPASETRAFGDDLLTLFSGGLPTSNSGITVSASTALTVPAVRVAVELIAGVLGTLPVKVFRPVAAGGKEVADDHRGPIRHPGAGMG